MQAKRQLRRVFLLEFKETGQFRTVFWTSLSFLTKVANFKQNVSCAEGFDANFFSNRTVAHSVLHKV